MSPLSVSVGKSLLNLTGVAAVITAFGNWDMNAVLTLGLAIVGVISVAAVMRSRVDTLQVELDKIKTWKDAYKDSQATLHQTLGESLAELKQMNKEQQRRVKELEDRVWDSR